MTFINCTSLKASGDHSVKGLIGPVMQTIFIILSWYFRSVDKMLVIHQNYNHERNEPKG
jgi:hypothetical protein